MRKIISLILIIGLVISLSACGQSKNNLITAVGSTCFDDYYLSEGLYTPDAPFCGMTLNEILLEYSNTSNFSWSVNKDIPFFKNLSNQYDSTQFDLVCLTLNSKNTSSKSNTVFSVNKDTQMVIPLGWISADGKLNTQPNNAIVHIYMLIDDEQKEIDTSKSMPISGVATVTSEETQTNSKNNNTTYYSCLTEDGSGLKFNVTPQEFLDRYNSLKSSYEDGNYRDIELSDFFYIEDGTSINGTPGEAYGCSQTIMGEFSDLVICINQEKNGNSILSVSFGIKNNKYTDMYYSDEMFPKIVTQYKLLICAITECDMSTATKYLDEMLSNGKNTKNIATYDKGIAFTYDTSNSMADWYRIIPCTKEQYDNAF